MTIRPYLVTMALSAILCWLSWGLTLINIDPEAGTKLGLAFFYASFFLAFGGTVSLILFYVYQHRFKVEAPLFTYVSKSFREAFVVSGFATLALYLLGKEWLSLWTGSLLATLFILVMSLFWSLAPRHQSAGTRPEGSNFI